ncbi:hypothetical protein L599_000200000700 [Luteimonas sp. J16]|jgi:hypothetical protein|uniref:hypothetical protein n=1 Tax=unclassified Luteimonas TaxID=2629088 RepID=UPI00047961DB|nr:MULTISPECIES: hypothetical protein [unclassified Luteimonas]TWG92198.1 hypothetical protein L599_000200000700 [Luteimonas sp. J16]
MPRYLIRLPDPERARAAGEFAFRSQGADGLAGELQEALRGDALFQRWRAAQEDPDAVDPALGATDPSATVEGAQSDLHIELVANTSIPGSVFKHRMRLLAGSAWELRDVR